MVVSTKALTNLALVTADSVVRVATVAARVVIDLKLWVVAEAILAMAPTVSCW